MSSFTVSLGPLQSGRISFELVLVLLAFAGAEPVNLAGSPDKHLAGSLLHFPTAESTLNHRDHRLSAELQSLFQ